jgi:hypothetical protein
MNIKGKSVHWGTMVVVVGSWLGAMIMLLVMYDMMLSMRAMRGHMEGMAQHIQGMSGNMTAMRQDMGHMTGYMEVMSIEFTEVDEHMWNMYQLMSEDLDQMRYSMQTMAPSVSSMGPVMRSMGYDMNRGVDSFTNPASYLWNMMH